MLDFGSWEILIVLVVALIVIGPKDLPAAIRTVRTYLTRARELARDFRSGLDDMVREAELHEVRKDIESALDTEELADIGRGVRDDLKGEIDPKGDIWDAFEPPEDEPEQRSIRARRPAPAGVAPADGTAEPEPWPEAPAEAADTEIGPARRDDAAAADEPPSRARTGT